MHRLMNWLFGRHAAEPERENPLLLNLRLTEDEKARQIIDQIRDRLEKVEDEIRCRVCPEQEPQK